MIHLVQLLCPLRHAVMAAAYDPEQGETEADAKVGILEMLDALGVSRRCALCGRDELHFEDAETPFETMEAARPALERAQADNLRSRDIILGRRRRP